MPTRAVARHPGLHRMVYPQRGIAAYRVKLMRRGALFQEYFPFSRYRSEAAALADAKKCWREITRNFPQISRRETCEVERRASSTGIIGVTRLRRNIEGREYAFWQATFTQPDGQRKLRSFSVGRYGEAEAKKRAVRVRRAALAQLDA